MQRQNRRRITPAWAGKSGSGLPEDNALRDHPRVGGEKAPSATIVSFALGSPPRGRGKDAIQRHASRCVGITPAWAGKSIGVMCVRHDHRDHPRVGGEKCALLRILPLTLGSPPRGRGKVSVLLNNDFHIRITPAWAGKRCFQIGLFHRRRDHPRVGGEKLFAVVACPALKGSPPRGRGKAGCAALRWSFGGITPAWAGKSPLSALEVVCRGDHPRVGGEKFNAYAKIWNEWGSPPRGRGKAVRLKYDTAAERITPAWAGKRKPTTTTSSSATDHPRVGGEKLEWAPITFLMLGSPPRGRGKVTDCICPFIIHGITPAWAGKSLNGPQ